jgi:ATP-dependent DNA helicase 2 subunit 2
MTEQEAARLKENGPKGEEDDSIKQIGSVNPISDFKQMVNDRKVDRVNDALSQMQSIIERYIRCSLNGDLYDKAMDCLKQVRASCIAEDEAPNFNRFMQKIKDKYSIGPHASFFALLVKD